MKLTSFLIFSLLTLIKTVNSSECPEGFAPTSLELVNPYGQKTILFNCKNNERREFLFVNDTKKYIATVHQKLNEETGEEYFTLNTLNIFNNDELVEYSKLENNGEVSRHEIYQDGKVIKKYVSQAQMYQEFRYDEEIDDSVVIRDCHYDPIADQLIEEIHQTDLHIKFALTMTNATEANIYAKYTFSAFNNKNEALLSIVPTHHDSQLEYKASEYRPDICIHERLIPPTLYGVIKTKTKIYTTSTDKWVDLQLVTELLKKDKKEELHTYLASISFDIKEVEAEELNTPPEVIPPPIDNNEASPNSPSSPPVEVNDNTSNTEPSTSTPSVTNVPEERVTEQ